MDIKLDMFCLSMKNQVVCKGNKAKIVTPKHQRVSNRNPEFLKKRLNPGEFSCYSSEALIFYLSRRARDSGLLICTPSNEVGTQKKRVTTSRFSIIGIGGPISIQRSHQIERRMKLEEKTIVASVVQVTKNAFNNFPIQLQWLVHELTYAINSESNFRASDEGH